MNQKGPLVKGISTELQDAVLSMLIFDNEMYDASKEVMSEQFFTGDEYKILYNALVKFHKTNNANPTLKDMMIQVSLLVTNSTELIKVKALLKQLNSDYINEYVEKESTVKVTYFEEFVKRNGTEHCFSVVLDDLKSEKGVDWRKVNDKLKKYTDFTIVQTQPYHMNDMDNFSKIRKAAIGDDKTTKKIRFFLDSVNNTFNHKALVPGTITMISASPGVGKTLTLINQGVSATQDGFTNLHIFLGDLNAYDATCRYLANYSDRPLKEIVNMTEEEQLNLIKDLAKEENAAINNNWVIPIASGYIGVDQLIAEIIKMQMNNNVHFDQIIVDYDSNIKPSTDSMYDSGGEIYDKLRAFAEKNSSVMLVASQPKITFFNQEVLTLEAASESSRKQHIIDCMLTIGRPGKLQCPVACMFIPKNRNGIANKKIFLWIDGSRQKVQEISEDEYERQKREAANRE